MISSESVTTITSLNKPVEIIFWYVLTITGTPPKSIKSFFSNLVEFNRAGIRAEIVIY